MILRLLFCSICFAISSCASKKDQAKTNTPRTTDFLKQANIAVSDSTLIKAQAIIDSTKLYSTDSIINFIYTYLENSEVGSLDKVNVCKWLLQPPIWNKVDSMRQMEMFIHFGQRNIALKNYIDAIKGLEYALTNYGAQLRKQPGAYLLANLELAFAYSSNYNNLNVVEYAEKALVIAEQYKDSIKLVDYVTAFNNLMYYQKTNKEKANYFERFNHFKTNYIDTLKTIDPRALDYFNIVFKRYQIISLLSKDDTSLALKNLQSFTSWKTVTTTDMIATKENYLIATYGDLYNYYFYDQRDYIKAYSFAKSIYTLSNASKIKEKYLMGALAKLATVTKELALHKESNEYLDKINTLNLTPANTTSSYYSLKMIRAENLKKLELIYPCISLLDTTLLALAQNKLNSNTPIENCDTLDFSKINAEYFINIYAKAASLYIDCYKNVKDVKLLYKAKATVQVAVKLFSSYYQNGLFDGALSNYHRSISSSLLYLTTNNQFNLHLSKETALNTIEKTASKHLFKQFQTQVILSNNALKSLYTKKENLQAIYTDQANRLLIKEDISLNIANKALQNEIATLDASIKKALNGFANVSDDFEFKNIQQQLAANETIIKFYVTSQQTYAAYITKNSLKIEDIAATDSLQKLVETYVTQLKNPKSSTTLLAESLYKMLFKTSISKQVIIVPQSFLNYLPFESLVSPQQSTLVQQHNFTYYFSLPLFYASRVYPSISKSDKALLFSANYTASKSNLGTLPFATSEVKSIAEIIKAETNIHATKQDFIDGKDKYKVFHLAMHAALNDYDFEQSYLLFSNDEPLYFRELYKMNLPLDMIVLSACNTGVGKINEGEGIMSLSKALTFAGVNSAVVSYWQVPDAETAEIMQYFYKNLRDGCDKSTALAKAKSTFLKNNPLKQHPYYWAGFVLNGNNNVLYPLHNQLYWLGGFIVAVLSIIGIKKYYQSKSFKS